MFIRFEAVPNPCLASRTQFHPFAYSRRAYINCDGESIFFQPCYGFLYWNQEDKRCDRELPNLLKSENLFSFKEKLPNNEKSKRKEKWFGMRNSKNKLIYFSCRNSIPTDLSSSANVENLGKIISREVFDLLSLLSSFQGRNRENPRFISWDGKKDFLMTETKSNRWRKLIETFVCRSVASSKNISMNIGCESFYLFYSLFLSLSFKVKLEQNIHGFLIKTKVKKIKRRSVGNEIEKENEIYERDHLQETVHRLVSNF